MIINGKNTPQKAPSKNNIMTSFCKTLYKSDDTLSNVILCTTYILNAYITLKTSTAFNKGSYCKQRWYCGELFNILVETWQCM